MRQILLHRAAADNAGGFRDAGTTLAIADGTDPDTIDAERAAALVASEGAVDADAPPVLDALLPDHLIEHED